MQIKDLPNQIPVFPLSNFIIFPKTIVPLNIFEPRYIEMINDSMKSNKMIGMIQPKKYDDNSTIPSLYDVGCLGKISYLPHITRSDSGEPFVREWKDGEKI